MKFSKNGLLYDIKKCKLIYSGKRKHGYGGGGCPGGSGYIGDEKKDFYVTENKNLFVLITFWWNRNIFWKSPSKIPEYCIYTRSPSIMWEELKAENAPKTILDIFEKEYLKKA